MTKFLSNSFPAAVTKFANGKVVAKMTNKLISEASGICASRKYPGVLYTNNDSGETNRFFAIRFGRL